MATYRAVATTETDPQAPITSALMKALEANHRAAMEGDSTAVSAGVTLLDAALNTGAATTAGTTWVGLRIAAMNVGDVGSYAFLTQNTPSAQSPGATAAGSGLLYSNAAASTPATAPAGTWRLMGRTSGGAGTGATSVWLRIS